MSPHQTVFLRLPSPFGTLQLNLETATPLSAFSDIFPDTYLRTSSRILDEDACLSDICHAANPSHPVTLELCARLRGGKGGFGSQLRAAGGRMSSGKASNVDSCRDLSGRRLSTLKEAQRQAELIESVPALRAAAQAAEKAKLEGLERQLGISTPDAESSSSASKRAADVTTADLEELARKKHKFDDNRFLEESREINESVRSAVSAALLKKRKKAKTESGTATAGAKTGVDQAKKAEKDKIAMPPPSVAKASTALAA